MKQNRRKPKTSANNSEQLQELHALAQELKAMSSGARPPIPYASNLSGGYDMADTLHNVYLDYGYPANLTFSNFWNMYRRFGVAKQVVESPVNICWSTPPEVIAPDVFLSELERIDSRIRLWDRLKGLDNRQRVGRYAGMFMRVKDGKNPSEPIDGILPSEAALFEMIPLYESQLEVIKSDTDPTSETYGQPILVQYNQSIVGSRNEEAKQTISIHASRIVFAAEGADNGWIYGVPALEAVYNSLMDLRKIVGGGAEGFYRNAAQSVIFNLKDTASASSFADKLQQFNDQYDDFTKNRARRAMWTPGMEAKTLESSLMSPKDHFEAALNDVAAGSSIPAKILIGQQTGRLASDEDGKHYLSINQSRRLNFCTEMTRNIFDWLIKYGVLPSAEYDLEWDDLLARSESEKLENSLNMSRINETQFKSGQSAVFTSEEIRLAAGYEEEVVEEDLIGEQLPDDLLEDDE